MRPIVVTATDTGVGKTVFASALAAALGAHYWKPVQAGLEPPTDAMSAASLGVPADRILAEAYRLHDPLSPHVAAERMQLEIEPARLAFPTVEDRLVVEGAGGVLVPLTPRLLFADLFASWGAPVVLVARTALGTINHSLLSIEALRSRGVAVIGIAFNGDANEESESTIAAMANVKRLGRLPVIDPLDAAALASAFAANFDLADFQS
jgi:dethiobiotin synthetase